MDKKEIQRNRIMSYFIDAAAKIIEEEGVDNITIRKVADIAGYNSATLYNYFENIDHLIFFAAMKYMKDYVQNVPKYIKGCKDAVCKYLKVWECFCYYSFTKPEVYFIIFFSKPEESFEHRVEEYYKIYPEDLGEQPKELLPMLLNDNIYERGIGLLESCISEWNIDKDTVFEINEMSHLIYRGMLAKIMNEEIDYTVDEAVIVTIRYIKRIIDIYKKE